MVHREYGIELLGFHKNGSNFLSVCAKIGSPWSIPTKISYVFLIPMLATCPVQLFLVNIGREMKFEVFTGWQWKRRQEIPPKRNNLQNCTVSNYRRQSRQRLWPLLLLIMMVMISLPLYPTPPLLALPSPNTHLSLLLHRFSFISFWGSTFVRFHFWCLDSYHAKSLVLQENPFPISRILLHYFSDWNCGSFGSIIKR